jgi:hypothetical protein
VAARRSQAGHIIAGRRRSPAQRHPGGLRPRKGTAGWPEVGILDEFLVLYLPTLGATPQRNIVLPKSFWAELILFLHGLGARILGTSAVLGASAGGGPDQGARILGICERHSQAPTLDARTIPPPGRTEGTTLNSTHAANDSRAASSASVCSKCRLMRCVNSTFAEPLPFAFCALRALYGLLRG